MIPLLLALVSLAALIDVRESRIPNALTYPGALLAIAVNMSASALGVAGDSSTGFLGLIGAGASLGGFLLCGGVMLAAYLFYPVGGGDLKLLAMIGAFLGPERGIETLLWTFLLAGVSGLAIYMGAVGLRLSILRGGRLALNALGVADGRPPNLQEQATLERPLHLAPFALIAIVIVCSLAPILV